MELKRTLVQNATELGNAFGFCPSIFSNVGLRWRRTFHLCIFNHLLLCYLKNIMREHILLLAYNACEKKSKLFEKHPHQYQSAINLISLLIFIHITQLVFLLFGFNYTNDTTYLALRYLAFIFSFFAIRFLVKLIFSKSVLAKSIKYNKENKLFKYSKLISFSYLLVNMLILSLIIIAKY
jgi:hypothetical protein